MCSRGHRLGGLEGRHTPDVSVLHADSRGLTVGRTTCHLSLVSASIL